MSAPLVRVEGLRVEFPVTRGLFRRVVGGVRVLDGVDLEIHPGETLALVGESGSGKTTLARAVLRLIRPSAGRIWLDGEEITQLDARSLRPLRRQMQIVFQDPSSSLNPRRRVREILEEPLVIHRVGSAAERLHRVRELLELVELPPAFLHRYPHHLSGGQRQRVAIARALALRPRLLVLDEPTSALDVSVQAKIVGLLRRLQRELGLTYLFITHDLALVRNVADRVAVLYLGRVVEEGPCAQVFAEPRHPYTAALLGAIPTLDEDERRLLPARVALRGEVPSPARRPPGCPFHPRCPQAMPRCAEVSPGAAGDDRHRAWCHLYG